LEAQHDTAAGARPMRWRAGELRSFSSVPPVAILKP